MKGVLSRPGSFSVGGYRRSRSPFRVALFPKAYNIAHSASMELRRNGGDNDPKIRDKTVGNRLLANVTIGRLVKSS